MKKIFLAALMVAAVLTAQAQVKPENALEIKKGKYYRGTQKIEKEDFVAELYKNETAKKLWKSGQSSQLVGGVFMGAGTGLVLSTLFTETTTENLNNKLTTIGVGAGLDVVGLIFYYSGKKKADDAVDTYNSTKVGVKFKTSSNGIGLVINF